MQNTIKNRELSEAREIKLLEKAIDMVPKDRRRVAIDGGANVGNWSIVMSEYFEQVYAFEPVSDTFATLLRNTECISNVFASQMALMHVAGEAVMVSPKNRSTSTAYHVHAASAKNIDLERVPAITIDSLKLDHCDLLKLDLEGAEQRALLGAVRTIKRCQPLIIVEVISKQLRRYKDTALGVDQFLAKLGYGQVAQQEPNRVYKMVKK